MFYTGVYLKDIFTVFVRVQDSTHKQSCQPLCKHQCFPMTLKPALVYFHAYFHTGTAEVTVQEYAAC